MAIELLYEGFISSLEINDFPFEKTPSEIIKWSQIALLFPLKGARGAHEPAVRHGLRRGAHGVAELRRRDARGHGRRRRRHQPPQRTRGQRD